jgi:hypothetical protein
LESPKIGTKELCSTLTGDFIDCETCCLKARVVKSEERVYGVVSSVCGATLNSAMLSAADWEDGVLRQDAVKQCRHERFLGAD